MTFLRQMILTMMVILTACSSAPPQLYLLDTSQGPVPDIRTASRVGLAEVSLPSYARRQTIASLAGDHRVVQDDDHRWAEPPAEAVTRALGQALETRLGRAVVLSPYPRGLLPEIQIRVSFDRFLRGRGGTADMHGQVLIVSTLDGSVAWIERFRIAVPAGGEGYEAFMRAVSRGVDELAERIAAAVPLSEKS